MPEVIKALLRSRGFLTAILAVISTIVVSLVPAFAPYVGTFQTVILALAALVIGGWKLEDFAEKFHAVGADAKLQEFFEMVLDILDDFAERLPEVEVAKDPDTQTTTTTVTKTEVETPLNG